MKSVKSILMLVVMLLIFVLETGFLMSQYKLYKKAFSELEKTILHQSIEAGGFSTEEGCE